jgi:hypothetical protein
MAKKAKKGKEELQTTNYWISHTGIKVHGVITDLNEAELPTKSWVTDNLPFVVPISKINFLQRCSVSICTYPIEILSTDSLRNFLLKILNTP